jgi:excisionase family DNA binding protein
VEKIEKQRVRVRYLTVNQAAEYLSVSQRTIRNLLVEVVNPLPHFRKGRMIRIRRSELDRWIEAYRAVNYTDVDKVIDDVLA